MLQGFQPADHGLDAGAYLLVLREKRGALGRQRLVPLPQCAILFPQMIHGAHQLLDTSREASQLEVELRFEGVAHGGCDYSAALSAGSIVSGGVYNAWAHDPSHPR